MAAARSSVVFFIFEIPDVNHSTTRSAEKKEKNVTDKTRVQLNIKQGAGWSPSWVNRSQRQRQGGRHQQKV